MDREAIVLPKKVRDWLEQEAKVRRMPVDRLVFECVVDYIRARGDNVVPITKNKKTKQ
jgi:hypothetical protein